MSFLKSLLTNKAGTSRSIIKNSLIAGTVIFSGFGQDVMAKGKSYVAVEPLVCDLVKSIALPSDEVTCLVDRKQEFMTLRSIQDKLNYLITPIKYSLLVKK